MSNYVCKRCGNLIKVQLADYCDSCRRKNQEDFMTIRDYLNNDGEDDIYSISKNTGVSIKVINLLLKEQSLTIKCSETERD